MPHNEVEVRGNLSIVFYVFYVLYVFCEFCATIVSEFGTARFLGS